MCLKCAPKKKESLLNIYSLVKIYNSQFRKLHKTQSKITEWINKYGIKNYTLVPSLKCGFEVNVDQLVIFFILKIFILFL